MTVKGVNLFGYPHGADLGGHGRSGPGSYHEGCEHRAQFSEQPERSGGPDQGFRPEEAEPMMGLQCAHHPGEHAGEQYNCWSDRIPMNSICLKNCFKNTGGLISQ